MRNTRLSKLKKMAVEYGVQDNALFMAAAEQYALQLRVIDGIRAELDSQEELTTEKEYVKGSKNVYANPLVKELAKHSDSANRTAATLLNIIQALGHKQESKDKLTEFLNDE